MSAENSARDVDNYTGTKARTAPIDVHFSSVSSLSSVLSTSSAGSRSRHCRQRAAALSLSQSLSPRDSRLEELVGDCQHLEL